MVEIKDIERLSELARIKLAPDELEAMRTDIDAILGYVGQLQGVAANLDAGPRPGAVRNVMREDADPHESGIYTEALFAEAPSRDGNRLKVKKILGGGDSA